MNTNRLYRLTTVFILFVLMLIIISTGGCSNEPNHLQRIIDKGELVVITRNSATTYYEGPFGPTGMEYDLVKGFADELGVKVKPIVATTLSEIFSLLKEGKGDIAAAGLTITNERKREMLFTPSYQTITQQIIYRLGEGKPRKLKDLDGTLEVVSDSSHAALLRKLHHEHKDLSWSENDTLDSEDLLSLVWEKVLDYTVADSNEFKIIQRYYPQLRVAFNLSQPESLAWAMNKSNDQSLYGAAVAYFNKLKSDGSLEQLKDRYYGHVQSFDYVGTRTYQRHFLERLPKYRHLFEFSAKEFDLDWRLIAAMAYQESHWNPRAVSPTGVRGIMMLTLDTAKYLGVKKRSDPAQSIRGGTIYFKKLLDKFEKIPMPDRLWFAVAAYNIGYYHVVDARKITSMRGGDATSWKDLRENLPLLRKRKWYKKVKRGYARGNEAVKYTENIRSYYDILIWLTSQNAPEEKEPPAALEISTPTL